MVAGHAVYTKHVLRAYDFVVLGLSNRLLWKCPTARLLEHYNQHISANHLDVGVGTGYFLDRCRYPLVMPRITLLDLNPNALEFASRRIARYRPCVHSHDVLKPLPADGECFDSVAINYVLHCLPGSIEAKAVVFDHLRRRMSPGAVLFGSTLLPGDFPLSWAARRLMSYYNEKGIFSNRCDTFAALERALADRFSQVSIYRVGCAALFSARI